VVAVGNIGTPEMCDGAGDNYADGKNKKDKRNSTFQQTNTSARKTWWRKGKPVLYRHTARKEGEQRWRAHWMSLSWVLLDMQTVRKTVTAGRV